MSLILDDSDKIDAALLSGLKDAIKQDLKDILEPIAEQVISEVISTLMNRFEVNLKSEKIFMNPDVLYNRKIHIDFLLKKE